MKILFLGTGAADWTSDLDRSKYGKEYRKNASAIVDDVILIDPGPWAYEAACEYGVDVSGVKYILNTHKHVDHFCEETLRKFEEKGAEYIEMTPGKQCWLGKYHIHALAGNHRCTTNHFLIYDGERRIFYGMDGAWLMYDEVQAIKENMVDLAVLDGTVGEKELDFRIFEHNNLRMVREMKKNLEPYIRRFCINHMARTLHTDHGTLSENMKTYGIEVAYDGMQIIL